VKPQRFEITQANADIDVFVESLHFDEQQNGSNEARTMFIARSSGLMKREGENPQQQEQST
jgi:hypothetical protein